MKFLTEDNREVNYYDRTRSWLKYKLKTKRRSKYNKITDEGTFKKIIYTTLKVLESTWTNSTGGVYMRHVGYLGIYRTPHKSISHRNLYSYVDRLETDGYMYIPAHFTNLRNCDTFYGFTLIERLPQRVKEDMYSNLKEGRRYTLNNFIIKEYLKNRRYL